MQATFVNLGLFKAGWAAVVLLAAAGRPAASTLAALAVVAVHVARAEDRTAEIRLLAAAGVIGLGWESMLVAAGLVTYPSGMFAEGIAPVWIVAMWLLFATTLNASMRWLQKSVAIASLAGVAGGALAFAAGAKAGAVVFTDPVLSPAAIAAGWSVLLPVMALLANRIHHGTHDRGDEQPARLTAVREPGR